MKKVLLALAVLLISFTSHAQNNKPLLLRTPALSRTEICFVYGDDLWKVSRDGGEAIRLTAGPGIKRGPSFSPDGQWIAFTGEYDGVVNVYVLPAAGGSPRRLTFHSGPDTAVGWTPDGRSVLFASPRDAYAFGIQRLYTVPLNGGFPTQLPLPLAYEGSYSADGSHIAYRPTPKPWGTWDHYRGGTAQQLWIADLSTSTVVKVPRVDWNDINPMWVGDKVYYLSDENGPYTLFAYDIKSQKNEQLLESKGLPIKSASAGPGAIVYERFGSLHLYDLSSHSEHAVNVNIDADLVQVRPHFEKVAKHIENAQISPTGVRAVFEAHGEILTAPAEKGDIRNLTNSPGVADRDPAWSPDGKWIAYFSDESGEYALHLSDQSGAGEVRKIDLGNPPSFFYSPTWSPDSKKIAYTDKRSNLWYIDLDNPTPVRVATNYYQDNAFNPSWSPDSRWIAYTKDLPNYLHAVFIYSLETRESTQITDGMSDAQSAAFDKNGKYLYFTASTNIGPTLYGLNMSTDDHTVTRSIYVVVLRKDLPSPLAPESDEEKVEGQNGNADNSKPAAGSDQKDQDKNAAKKNEPPKVAIDFDNISQRILALPIPARNYIGLTAGKEGELFVAALPPSAGPALPSFILYKFDLTKRKTDMLVAGIQNMAISFNGEKLLYQQGDDWFIASTAQPVKPGDGKLDIDDMEVWVDPPAEWKQMYHEAWRIERDFFYDPHYHGLNLPAVEKEYAAFLPGIATRDDLNYLFDQMLSELNVGHMFVRGGDIPEVPPIKVGLLGADYSIEKGRYRFQRVYNGENWNPLLHAPLTQPGVNVVAGEYLLAVNGRDLRASDDIYSFFQETAGKQTVLKVGTNADGSGSRNVTVVPIENEEPLRNRAWIEDNIRKVGEMSGGKLGYVYLPDTANGGFTNFNRYYFAALNKQGAVIDERFNTGGQAADYIIEIMQRKIWSYWTPREGGISTTPLGLFGPKAMVTNEFSGSGGDALPWYFHHVGLGPLVGKRTWGGLVGIGGYPPLMDDGTVTAPHFAFFNTDGQWDVENHGVQPDYEIEMDPHAWREGHDPQLEKAVQLVMEELKKNPPPVPKRPPYPNYSKYSSVH
jgi:tricorn protease